MFKPRMDTDGEADDLDVVVKAVDQDVKVKVDDIVDCLISDNDRRKLIRVSKFYNEDVSLTERHIRSEDTCASEDLITRTFWRTSSSTSIQTLSMTLCNLIKTFFCL